MVNMDRMQRMICRLVDTACSLFAFIMAYATLPLMRSGAEHLIRNYLGPAGGLSPLSADEHFPGWQELLWIFVVVTLTMSLAFEYRNDSSPIHVRKVRDIVLLQIMSMMICVGVVATVFYAFHVPLYSRLFVCGYVCWLLATTICYRLVLKSVIAVYRNQGTAMRRTIIAGRPEGIARFVALTSSVLEHQIAGCLLTRTWNDDALLGIPVLGNMSIIGELLIHQPIDEVIMVVPPEDTGWVPPAVAQCDYFRVSVNVVHESFMDMELRDLRIPFARHSIPSVSLIPEEEFASNALVWKRITDVIISAIALIVLAPLMVMIAVAIKLTTPDLPVFYRWNVVGYRGRRFAGYKFTTMVADADERKRSLAPLNEMSGPVFKIRNDPRVTPLGRFLRKYSLNELPQLWSVLIGDMSLVGPRPAGPHELVGYELWQKRKLSVRPGITCFWQVRGRNAISNFDDWVRMDLEYIQRRSTWTDMSILFQTVLVVLRGTGS